jgi:putative endonuclease
MYVVYVLYSPTINKFYIGSTSDFEKRIYYHNNGKSPYTRNKGPLLPVYRENYETRKEAVRRERELKNWKSSKRITMDLEIDISTYCSGGGIEDGQ